MVNTSVNRKCGSTPIENGERLIYFGAIIEKDKINKILKERENEFES